MSSAGYVGRVGALAVALGIGAVIAGVPGVAWAGTEGESDPSDAPGVSAAENPDGSAGDPSDIDVGGGDLGDLGDGGGVGDEGDGSDVDGAGDAAGGMQVEISGGAITSTNPGSAGAKSEEKDRDADPPKKRAAAKQKAFSVAPSLTKTTTHSTEITVAEPGPKVRAQAPVLSIASPKDPGPQIKPSTSPPVDVAPVTLAAPGLQKPVAARMTAVTKPLAQSSVLRLLPFVTLAPTADGKLPGSTEPLFLGFLAAGREVDRKASVEDESLARTVDSTETSLMTTATNSLTSFQVKATRTSTNLDITPPTVSLTAPTNNASVSGTVSLAASASDNVKVTGVQFFVDNNTTPLATDTSSPYSASWNTTTVTNGTHTLTAKAYDAAGNINTSTVTVTVDNTKPTVNLTAPTSDAQVSGTAVTLSATASDNDRVTQVQFFVDNNTTPLATDTSSPYSASWNTTTVTNGTHTLTAKAYDAAGNINTSTVTVTVDNTKPTVNLTAPTSDAQVSGTAVTLSATASDNVGVTQVQFFVDNNTTPLATDTSSPYSASWNTTTVTNGTHTLTAKAYDAAGNINTSTVTVTVANSDITAPNQAPVATTPVFNSRNAATGVVTGSWTVTDGDGNPLTYSVTGPTRGTVEITRQGDTFNYVYTPSQAERFAALNTAQADYDQFAVSVSDGRASTTVNVSVPVLPANIGDTAFVTYLPAGTDPSGVTVVGDRAYVLNPGNNTVTIMTAGQYPNVIATIPVSTTPTSVAVNPQYHRAYIGGTSSVMVINTDDNTTVTTIPTAGGQVYGIAVSPDGSKVYATNTTAGTVSVINPANNTVVGTIQLGSNPAGVTFTPDGRFAYVANMGSNTVTVINASTNTPIASIVVGINPAQVAVSPDGKWAYVTNYTSNTVSYIDTATNTVVGSPLSVAEKPYGISTSPDGSILYVASANGTAMYDAKTRRWISTIWSDNNNPRRTSAVYRDGLFIYTTNTNEDLLRTTSIIRGNTAPVTTGSPTVGTPDPVLGAVSGSLNVDDPDGDWLTYRVSAPSSAGTVSFNGAGGYTFTPTQAARDAAALTQGADYTTFTVIASDSVYPASQGSVAVTVTVPIAPSGAAIPTTTTAINVGSPGKVVISNGRAYVYNTSNRTIAVIDPATNQVTATIPVPAANDFVVGNDGRIYVMRYDTVSVINPDGTQGAPPVRIPDLCETEGCWGSSGGLTDIAINPAGTSVYVVRQYYTDIGAFSTVSMIDTSSNTVVNTVSTYPFSDIEVTPDGTRIYAAENDYRVVPVLSAINLTSAGGVGVTAPGEWPYVTNVSISPDGKRTYALVGGTAWAYDPTVAISVIDSDPTSSTYNTQIATIALPGATDVAFSPDSRRAYILMNDGKTVRVVDTATSTVVGYFTVPGANSIAVAPNGTVYLTHAAAGTVYAVTVGGTTSPL